MLSERSEFSLGSRGGMAEWLMAAVLKTVMRESVSGVRIPLPPLLKFVLCCMFLLERWPSGLRHRLAKATYG